MRLYGRSTGRLCWTLAPWRQELRWTGVRQPAPLVSKSARLVPRLEDESNGRRARLALRRRTSLAALRSEARRRATGHPSCCNDLPSS